MAFQTGVKQDSTNKLILVCDDVADNCFFLQTILEIEGYEVDIVESGAAALARLESKVPDLLLLDVMMPYMDGYEVARRIRNNPILQSLTILLITADEEAFLRKEPDVKVAGVIRKPVDPDVLIGYVQAALQQRHHF
ncbi:response regulator [Komarekiella sp. 'clone 1']|uniref:Response regulator n=1 Tax=Komarekiella delphini-convector SJRDD-AB1 TaxID=2593771 RepID=A0AA40VUH7_9NOST|nr:response regulator [Komarekiella delphini-convector]MBD6619726.1 response regulator [Komarekiella delphini-convector SJRDD-AB1]